MRDLIGTEGAASAGVIRPAEHPGLEEGAIDDQLRAALEQINEAYLTVRSVERVIRVDSYPRHAAAFGGQCIARTREGFLFHKELLARGLPLLLRYDRGSLHREIPFSVFFAFLYTRGHLIFLFGLKQTGTVGFEKGSEL